MRVDATRATQELTLRPPRAAQTAPQAHPAQALEARATQRGQLDPGPQTREAPAPSAPRQSGAVAAYDRVRDTLDLSQAGRNIVSALDQTQPFDVQDYLGMLATLLKQGVIGTEHEVAGAGPQERFAEVTVGAAYTRGARTYEPVTTPRPERLDVRV